MKSGALRVTDPCYDMETWCAGTLESVKNGKWFAHVGYFIDQDEIAMSRKWRAEKIKELEDQIAACPDGEIGRVTKFLCEHDLAELRDQGDPADGYLGRVAYIAIRHESAIYCTPPHLDNFEESEIHVGVDSGQAGFFDLEPFKKQSETEEENGGYGQDTEHGKFYRSICEQTCDGDGTFAIVPFGAASESGYGDGGYSLYFLRDKDGQVIEAIIIFIGEYDEE